jgi:HD-GYP domain-containing protein (c-di-GMP phosphodiesterase class II)
MQLSKPIYDVKKRILLNAESKIHPKYMDKLKEIGIKFVFIEDAKSAGISLDEMIDMPTWIDMVGVVEKAFVSSVNNQPLPLMDLQRATKKLIEEVKQRRTIILIPTSTIDSLLQPFAHAVNVTLIALQIGKQLGYTYSQLNDLGIGCFLHDIGKTKSSVKEDHPEKGFAIIKANREISLLSAHVAYQHHEKLNGEGFPRKLKGDDILEYAQICRIANDYENMISTEEISPNEAIEKIMALTDVNYVHKIVLAFTNTIIGYPPGTNVVLSNGEKGIVSRIESHLQRPIVKIYDTNSEIDLSEQATLFIEEIVTGA